MHRQKENGLVLEEKYGTIYIVLKLTIKRRMLWILLTLLTLVQLTLGSSLHGDIRKVILDFLISAMQLVLFAERRSKS